MLLATKTWAEADGVYFLPLQAVEVTAFKAIVLGSSDIREDVVMGKKGGDHGLVDDLLLLTVLLSL